LLQIIVSLDRALQFGGIHADARCQRQQVGCLDQIACLDQPPTAPCPGQRKAQSIRSQEGRVTDEMGGNGGTVSWDRNMPITTS
jgi:hypothetical protein